MSTFKNEWDTATAMKILQHPTVDGKLWSEAVEWLLLYGPPEVQELLKQASSHATSESFPEMQAVGYDADGSPCYTLEQLAQALGISEEEAAKTIAEKEKKHGTMHIVDKEETSPLQ